MAKHPLAIAWDEWSQSDDGVRCADATTMGAHAKQSYYLSKRLWRAFQAGIAAQEKLSGAAQRPTAKAPRRNRRSVSLAKRCTK